MLKGLPGLTGEPLQVAVSKDDVDGPVRLPASRRAEVRWDCSDGTEPPQPRAWRHPA